MLSSTLLYLLKANGALLLFALAYFGLLRRLTFFTLNRVYLLFALLFSAVYPLLPVPALLPPVAAAPVAVVTMDTAAVPTIAASAAPVPTDWNAVALAVYGAGTVLLLLRLLGQLLSLWRLRRLSRPAVVQGVAVRALPGEVSPFSFGAAIYLNPAQHPAPELAAVLRHEQVHVRQGHTLDVLLAQLAQASAWCNPAAWLLRRALLDNLEYLADRAALQTGLDRRAYQYSLLCLSQAQPGPALVSHFTFPTLKNRVVMMNTPLSSTGQLARYFVAGPLVLAATLGFSGARAQGAGPAVPVQAQAAPRDSRMGNNANYHNTHYIDGKVSSIAEELQLGAENVASMVVLKGEEARKISGNPQDEYVLVMTSKQNQHRPDVLAFNQKVAAAEAREQASMGAEARPAAVASRAPQQATPANKVKFPEPRAVKARSAQPMAVVASAPKSQPITLSKTQPLVYLDGQRYTGDINDIGASNIANMSVFKDNEKARQFFGDAANNGVLIVTTKAKENSAEVVAFNNKLNGMNTVPAAPAQPAASVPYLAPLALAYITQHYPAARLLGVTELKDASGGPSRYQAEIVLGRRPAYLTFDGAGKFLAESYTR